MAGGLTTHVLDTALGCPVVGMAIELWKINSDGDSKSLVKVLVTNANGRTDLPLLDAEEMRVGIYELVFMVGMYFQANSVGLTQPLFLDRIPVRFGIGDPNSHYHVPLLVSPWSYTTYRGS